MIYSLIAVGHLDIFLAHSTRLQTFILNHMDDLLT